MVSGIHPENKNLQLFYKIDLQFCKAKLDPKKQMITAYYWIKWQQHALPKLIPNNNRPGCCIRTCRCFWEYAIRSSSSSFLLNRARFKRFDHIRVFILVLCMVLSSEHTRYPDGSIQRSSPTCNLQDAVFVFTSVLKISLWVT